MPPPPRPVLVLRDVAKTFHAGVPGCAAAVRVLRGVDLVVWPGERVAVVGPPRSGKTTLVLLAAGLLSADRGELHRAPGAALAPPRRPPGAVGARDADRLHWRTAAARGASLVAVHGGAPAPVDATRVVALEGGRLRAVTPPPPVRRDGSARGRAVATSDGVALIPSPARPSFRAKSRPRPLAADAGRPPGAPP